MNIKDSYIHGADGKGVVKSLYFATGVESVLKLDGSANYNTAAAKDLVFLLADINGTKIGLPIPTLNQNTTGYASKVLTQSRATNASHYLVFVDSNNSSATAESLYTDAGISYNPSTDTLALTKVTVSAAAGFNYTGIENATTNAARNIWFANASGRGIPCYNDNFKFNPANNGTLYVNNISGTNIKITIGNTAVNLGGTYTPDTSISSSSTHNTIPSSLAVYNAILNGIAANDAMVFKGIINGGSSASATVYTPAADKGWTYKVGTAGYINGIYHNTNDTFICLEDSTAAATSSNVSTISTKWGIVEGNGDYLSIHGGTMDGTLKWKDSNALPLQTSPQYFLCIDSFADGGTTKYASVASTKTALGINASSANATIGTSLTTLATVNGVDIKAKIGSYAASNHTHSVIINGITKTIAAPGGTAVDLGNYVPKIAGTGSVVAHLKSVLDWKGCKIVIPGGYNSWMMAFTLRIYIGYQYTDIVFSGYHYGNNHWNAPSARIIGGTLRYKVVMGYEGDAANSLYVWIGKTDDTSFSYGGVTIMNLHAGHNDGPDWYGGWTFSDVAYSALTNIQYDTTPVLPSMSDHSHTLSIAASSEANQLSMTASTKYKLTAGGSTFVFTTPSHTDKTGIKLGTVSGTLKTDGTVIINNSSTGLTIQGGTNAFKIGDGTNYISVAVAHGLTTKNLIANGTSYAIYTSSSSLPNLDTFYTKHIRAIPYIVGPSTDTTAGTWTGTCSELSTIEDGTTIIYVPAVAGASTTTLNINGTGAKTCYYTNSSKLTTHFSVGTPIMFTYVGGAWKRADYDSNSNTWRNIYTLGTSRIGTATNTKAMNFVGTGNISIGFKAAGTGADQSGSADYFTVSVDAAANAVGVAGYVAAPSSSTSNQVWMTNASGLPAWRIVTVPSTVPTIGTSDTTLATIGGITVKAKIGSYASSSHTHYYLVTSGDNRSVVTTPDDYANKFTFVGLKSNSTLGISNAGTYSYLIGLRGWGDHSGGGSHELAFSQSLGLFRRIATDASTWGDWIRIADSSNVVNDNTTVALNTETTIATIAGVPIKIKVTGTNNVTTSAVVSSSASGVTQITAAQSDPYYNLIEGGSVTRSIQFKHGDDLSISASTTGVITYSLPVRLKALITSDTGTTIFNGFGRIQSGGPFESFHTSAKDCMIVSTGYSSAWGGQLALDYRTNNIAYRAYNNGTWTDWALMASNKNVVNDNITVSWNTETTIATIAGVPIKIKIPNNPNVSTTAVVSSSASGTSQITAAQSNPYYNLIEGTSVTRSIRFLAGGGMSISSATDGQITFTNTGVRSTTINGNYLKVNTNGTDANLTINYAVATSVLNSSQISTDTDITQSGVRAYTGIGSNWTGSITSMAYAAMLTFGSPSRGWQMWAGRTSASDGGGMSWRRGNSDATAWEDPRLFFDSGNSSVSGGGSTWGSSLTVKLGTTTCTLTIPSLSSLVTLLYTGTLSLSVSAWTTVAAVNTYDAGTYVLQIYSGNMYASGVFSLCKNTDAINDEIPLHVANTSNGWRPYAKINGNNLLMSSNEATGSSRSYTIKIFKLI